MNEERIRRLERQIGMIGRPSISFYEGWQDSVGIDSTIWTVTDPVGGTPWSLAESGAFLTAMTAPALDNVARLVGDISYPIGPDTWGSNTIIRKLFMEFEVKFTGLANIDNANSFFGFTGGAADIRTSNDIVGFALASDVLQTVTDDGGTETVFTTFGETLTNWNRLGLVVASGEILFYLNGTQIAAHVTNLPDEPMMLNYYLDTEGGGAATIELGIIRIWSEDAL